MDPMALIAVLTGGGPTALIVVLGLVIWHQNRVITAIKEEIAQMRVEMHQVQIIQAQESNLKTDVTAKTIEIKEILKEHAYEVKETISKIFERIEEQNSRCGRDCLASFIAKERLSGGQR